MGSCISKLEEVLNAECALGIDACKGVIGAGAVAAELLLRKRFLSMSDRVIIGKLLWSKNFSPVCGSSAERLEKLLFANEAAFPPPAPVIDDGVQVEFVDELFPRKKAAKFPSDSKSVLNKSLSCVDELKSYFP